MEGGGDLSSIISEGSDFCFLYVVHMSNTAMEAFGVMTTCEPLGLSF
jgi:hypothetical protein